MNRLFISLENDHLALLDQDNVLEIQPKETVSMVVLFCFVFFFSFSLALSMN